MKRLILIIALSLGLLFFSSSQTEARTTRVKGYFKPSINRYIAPHYKTTSNNSKFDNFSTKGNFNPYTGKKGHVNPYKW